MANVRISQDLRPLSELKTRPADVVSHAQRTGRPVVLTRYGKGVAVLLSVEAYEDLELAAARVRLATGLHEAEREAAAGETVSFEEVDRVLEGWEQDGA